MYSNTLPNTPFPFRLLQKVQTEDVQTLPCQTTANKSSNGCSPLLVEAGDSFDEVFGGMAIFVNFRP